MECTPWDINWICDVSTEDPDLLDQVRDAAQTILWSMTGRRYGVCETTESYRMQCTTPCYVPWADNFGPGVEYRLYPESMRKCCAIALDTTPVRAITEVKVFGVVLDPSEYYLGRGILYRLGACWPCEDDCEIPPVEVSYTYGIDPPALAKFAMGELGCEILRSISGQDCTLPSNAVSVTRQGVTVDLGSPEILFAQNRLGLPLCDQFIRSVNPNRLHVSSKVYSPDMARRMR